MSKVFKPRLKTHVTLGLIAAALLALSPAHATAATNTIEVTDIVSNAPLSTAGEIAHDCDSTDITGGCTLRGAVQLAGILSTELSERVIVDIPKGTFTDSLGSLTVAEDAQVTLAGAGANASVIDGDGAGSVLTVERGASLTVRDLTLRNGHGAQGGAINVPRVATLIVERSTLENNTATGNGGAIFFGGAIAQPRVTRANPATRIGENIEPVEDLTISQSTIAYNSAAEKGGGIYEQTAREGGSFSLKEKSVVNTTITRNEAEVAGGIFVQATLIELTNDTVLENTTNTGQVEGNNLVASGRRSDILLHTTIVAETPESGRENCAGHIESDGYNLDNPSNSEPETSTIDACGMSTTEHDVVGVNPQLDPSGPKDNGGSTQTVALLAANSDESPAINAVPLTECGHPHFTEHTETLTPITVDQRGSARPSDPDEDCDIGAYEYSPTSVTPTCTTPDPVNPGEQTTLVCTIEKGNGKFATGTTASFTPPSGAALDSATPSQGTCENTICQLGTIDPATVTIVLSPTVSGAFEFTASDIETGAKHTSVRVTVTKHSPLAQPVARVAQTMPVTVLECVSQRSFKIHIQNAKRLKIISATVYVEGQLKQTLKGKALTAVVDMVGLRRGTFIVGIVAKTRRGKRLIGTRTYHTCATKLPGHEHLQL